MDIPLGWQLFIQVILIAVNAVFASAEIAIVSMNELKLEKLAEEGYNVGKINVDDEGELAERYHVMNIPTLIIFKNGKEKERMVGVQSKDLLESKLKALA